MLNADLHWLPGGKARFLQPVTLQVQAGVSAVTAGHTSGVVSTVCTDKGETNITPKLIKDQIYKTAYNEALNESGLGTGGKYHTALQAATAAIQGLAGGNIGQALAGGASPSQPIWV